MTDPNPPQTNDAREAEAVGEKPDRGHTPDQLSTSLTGTNMGSDTRAGSLRGGSASGSDNDPDQSQIDASLASEGMVTPKSKSDADPVNNTGDDNLGKSDGDEADAATG